MTFGSESFMPHGHCYFWTPGLLWLMVGSDILITTAYFIIPVILIYFIRRRKDVPFPSVFVLFSAFIICCGVTHLFSVITTWYPFYWVEGGLKLLTGVVSLATAYSLVPTLPVALSLRSPAELAAANNELEKANQELSDQNQRIQQMNEELIQTETLRRLNQELETFVGVASHDLRAPLRRIYTLSEILEETADDPGAVSERQEVLAILKEQSAAMQRLVNDLLKYYRAGLEAPQLEEVDVRALFAELLKLQDRPEGFVLRQESSIKQAVINRAALRQVIQNLLNNAVRHHDKAKGEILLSAHREDEQLVFTVQDDGPGIDPKYHSSIFQPLTTLQHSGGSGLGLALVKRMLTQNHATISVESEVGTGTRFIIRWPRVTRTNGA